LEGEFSPLFFFSFSLENLSKREAQEMIVPETATGSQVEQTLVNDEKFVREVGKIEK